MLALAHLRAHDDVSPVPNGEPASGKVLPGVRVPPRPRLPELWHPASSGGQVLRGVRAPARWTWTDSHSAPLRLARSLYAQAPRREDPHFEERPRRRAEAGHRPLRRPEGLDGTARGPGPRGGTKAPGPRARTDD